MRFRPNQATLGAADSFPFDNQYVSERSVSMLLNHGMGAVPQGSSWVKFTERAEVGERTWKVPEALS